MAGADLRRRLRPASAPRDRRAHRRRRSLAVARCTVGGRASGRLRDMSATVARPHAPAPPRVEPQAPAESPATGGGWRTITPPLVAAVLAAVYVIVSPATHDLAAHLFRAQLFASQGFGLWNNDWYGGHHILGYSVLFPAVSALLTPQLAAALAA